MALLTLAACGNISTPAASLTTAPPATSVPAATTSTRTTTPTTTRVQQWTMPNLVGMNLQQAQDAVQKLTGNPVFVTLSHDATAAGRQQVVDRNWKVCAQSVAAGATFTDSAKIDFATVKNEERCP